MAQTIKKADPLFVSIDWQDATRYLLPGQHFYETDAHGNITEMAVKATSFKNISYPRQLLSGQSICFMEGNIDQWAVAYLFTTDTGEKFCLGLNDANYFHTIKDIMDKTSIPFIQDILKTILANTLNEPSDYLLDLPSRDNNYHKGIIYDYITGAARLLPLNEQKEFVNMAYNTFAYFHYTLIAEINKRLGKRKSYIGPFIKYHGLYAYLFNNVPLITATENSKGYQLLYKEAEKYGVPYVTSDCYETKDWFWRIWMVKEARIKYMQAWTAQHNIT